VIKTVLQTNGLSADTIELPDNVPEQYCNLARVFLKVHANLLPEQRPYDCPIHHSNLTQPEMKALHTYIQENLEKGFIQSSCSPAGAPIFFVPKKDSELRPCVDYCGLNEITIKNRCPLPLLDNMIDQLRGSTIFTKIDLRGTYNLVQIQEGDEWKTAFHC
jgi:hypothetical protein